MPVVALVGWHLSERVRAPACGARARSRIRTLVSYSSAAGHDSLSAEGAKPGPIGGDKLVRSSIRLGAGYTSWRAVAGHPRPHGLPDGWVLPLGINDSDGGGRAARLAAPLSMLLGGGARPPDLEDQGSGGGRPSLLAGVPVAGALPLANSL